ncbi:MAG: DUF2251 domain-containing protein [Bacteroidetes bacterium]|nr:DUF2251 domain-containing protein [Bacteroidota bacterium]
MNGYLMQEQQWTPGEDLFVESLAPENRYGVVFEDDGEAAYFYAVQKDEEGGGISILDALHIHESEEPLDGEEYAPATEPANPKPLLIIWSRDWLKCALIIDGFCHALFDFENQGGYNINEFPPPNEFWTKGDRKLTDEMIKSIF